MSNIINEISLALQKGSSGTVTELVTKALDEGIPAEDILNQGLLAGMDIVADNFKNNIMYVPEVLVAARAMNAGAEILKPHLVASGVKPIGKAVIGTVKGDLHDIGKNILRMMLEGKGIEVIDVGVDASSEKFINAQKESNADVIGLSALLTTTMVEMDKTVAAFTEAGLRDDVIIMVGGAPLTEVYCRKAGADLYAADAATGAELAKNAILRKKGISQ